MAKDSDHRLASLDAARGIAIVLVILAHFMPAEIPIAAPLTVFSVNAGVMLFFFLSGFLMDRTLTHDSNPISYACRRAFRILPMYWISLILVVAMGANFTVPQLFANATFTAPAFG